jgi:putative molybdopterin biosynthesis protein
VKLITASEVARLTGVSTARIYDLARQGILPSVRLGRQLRFSESALHRWITNGGCALPGGWRRDKQPTSDTEEN